MGYLLAGSAGIVFTVSYFFLCILYVNLRQFVPLVCCRSSIARVNSFHIVVDSVMYFTTTQSFYVRNVLHGDSFRAVQSWFIATSVVVVVVVWRMPVAAGFWPKLVHQTLG